MKASKGPRQALLIGRHFYLAWTVPQLLARAGFMVDAISSYRLMKKSKFVRSCDIVPYRESLIPTIKKKCSLNYDWFIVTDDEVLTEILESDLSLEDKLKVLPVLSQDNFIHLFSKIGLSYVFHEHGVRTPDFYIASNLTEAKRGAGRLGYPLLVKQDASGGGFGIVECKKEKDFDQIKPDFFTKPVLVQKKIMGKELDLSALFLEGKLIYFIHGIMERNHLNAFGPSVLRTYKPLAFVEEKVFQELSYIGRVVGAHGFTNITCIESEGERYYIEVDMRPNVWVETSRYFEEDPARKIEHWFSKKECLQCPIEPLAGQKSQVLIPFFLRLEWYELLINRYKVWKFIPRDDIRLVMHVLVTNICINDRILSVGKWLVPHRYRSHVSRWYRQCLGISVKMV